MNLIPFFPLHIFLFSIPLTRYARYAPGGKKIPFLRVFIDADDVPAPMRHGPPPPPGISNSSAILEHLFFDIASNIITLRTFLPGNHNK